MAQRLDGSLRGLNPVLGWRDESVSVASEQVECRVNHNGWSSINVLYTESVSPSKVHFKIPSNILHTVIGPYWPCAGRVLASVGQLFLAQYQLYGWYF